MSTHQNFRPGPRILREADSECGSPFYLFELQLTFSTSLPFPRTARSSTDLRSSRRPGPNTFILTPETFCPLASAWGVSGSDGSPSPCSHISTRVLPNSCWLASHLARQPLSLRRVPLARCPPWRQLCKKMVRSRSSRSCEPHHDETERCLCLAREIIQKDGRGCL